MHNLVKNSFKDLVKPLFETDTQSFVIGFLVVYYLQFVVLAYEKMPNDCQVSTGTCRKLAQASFNFSYVIITVGLFCLWMSMVYRGVSKHGLNPRAYLNIASFYFMFVVLRVIFQDIYELFPTSVDITATASPAVSMKDLTQTYIGNLITVLGPVSRNVNSEIVPHELGLDNYSVQNFSPASVFLYSLLFGTLAGVVG